MFLARGKAGPFRVEGTAYAAPDGRVGVRMLIHDEGNGDRAITSATAVLAVLGIGGPAAASGPGAGPDAGARAPGGTGRS